MKVVPEDAWDLVAAAVCASAVFPLCINNRKSRKESIQLDVATLDPLQTFPHPLCKQASKARIFQVMGVPEKALLSACSLHSFLFFKALSPSD